MMDALREMPQVEAVAGLGFPMFEIGSSSGTKKYKDRFAYSYYNAVTDDFRDVMKIELVEGRWFEPADDALAYEPIVINRRLRDELFRGEDALGKTIFDQHQKRDLRVVGVISDFREDGELSPPDNYFLQRIGSKAGKPLEVMSLVVRLRSGTPPGFEEQIVKRLRSLSRDRTFYIESLAAKRRGYQKLQIAPLAAGGLVAGFMMVMVALGMIGVVWQSVTRRAREIGLRRAMGASARDIAVQVLAELILIATFGMALGTALVIQAPLLELVSWLTTPLFLASLAISLTCIYLLTIAAGLYPSWLASRVHPAGVLHYE
jgi:putative ABC transport system permease protein